MISEEHPLIGLAIALLSRNPSGVPPMLKGLMVGCFLRMGDDQFPTCVRPC